MKITTKSLKVCNENKNLKMAISDSDDKNMYINNLTEKNKCR